MEFKLKRFESVINIKRIANIHYFEFTKKYHTYKDNHAFCELVYTDSGEIEIASDNYTGRLKKNQMIVHLAGETHSLSCPDDTAPNVIIIGFECNCPELGMFSSTPVTLPPVSQKLLTEVIREGRTVFLPPYDIPNLKDMKKRSDYPYGADQMIKLKLEQFFIEIIRSQLTIKDKISQSGENCRIAEVYTYLSENFREKITLDELCFLYSTNKTTLCSSFKAVYSDTIVGYINKLRIRETKRLMREGNFNLTQISELVGFSSVHYLNRVFKNHEGKPPTEYIKTIKARLEV